MSKEAEAPLSSSAGTGGKLVKTLSFRHPHSTPHARPSGSSLKISSPIIPGIRPPAIESLSRRETTREPNEAGDSLISVGNNLTSEEPPRGVEDRKTLRDNGVRDDGGDEISKIEHIIKQKTFTRDEFYKLIKILKSRTIGLSAGNENVKAAEPSTSKPVVKIHKVDHTNLLVEGNEMQTSRLFKGCLKHDNGTDALEIEMASPTEIAKSYMRLRPSTPLVQSPFRCSTFSDMSTSPNSSLFRPKISDGLVASRPVIRFSNLLKTDHVTPELRDKFKIPKSHFEGYSSISKKVCLGTNQYIDAFAGPSRSQFDSPQASLSAGRLAGGYGGHGGMASASMLADGGNLRHSIGASTPFSSQTIAPVASRLLTADSSKRIRNNLYQGNTSTFPVTSVHFSQPRSRPSQAEPMEGD